MTQGSLRSAVAALACSVLLAACASRGPAPVSERTPAPAPLSKPPVAQAAPVPGAAAAEPARAELYRVKRGDTLYSIALDHGQDHRDLARWNRLDNPNRIQVGQLLRVAPPGAEEGVKIGAARGAGPLESRPLGGMEQPAPTTAADATRTEPKALRLPYSAENVALLQNSSAARPAQKSAAPPPEPPQAPARAEPGPAAAKPAAEPKEGEPLEFIWPARGKLLTAFAEPANKGVDIAGKPGDPVLAAAPGRVIYVGTGIRGYGKLIVIKHDNGFNSVYGHNREILVKQDQTVARGQKIAELGDTDSDVPKLHFEIRKSGKPVDPVKYLPAEPRS